MNAKLADVARGEMSRDDYNAWALESAECHARWVESLPLIQRAWIEAKEKANRHVVAPPGTDPVHIPDLFSKPDR